MTEATIARQHLIDPEVCIRCNTCEETCKPKAISHDRRNYVVSFELCNACGDCLPPCPTGAIDSWRRVVRPFSVEEQLGWDALPSDVTPESAVLPSIVPPEVERLEAAAMDAQGGASPPPWSAAHPYVGLYTPTNPAIAKVTGNYRLTAEGAEVDIRHIVLDFGNTAFPVLEGQSIGILPPGTDDKGRPHAIRLYSVASPRDGERPRHNNLALTVKRVTADQDGKPVQGVASNFLCDAKRGDSVNVTGPYGTTFLMPNHAGAKLLLVCTGTGAAPMRAMTERRRRKMASGASDGGSILLFFGARTPDELPYFGPLRKLPRELIDVRLAFSRVPSEASYVQGRIRQASAEVAALLKDDDTFIYICGHKRMESGVREAFGEIADANGLSWPDVEARLRREGRFHVETY